MTVQTKSMRQVGDEPASLGQMEDPSSIAARAQCLVGYAPAADPPLQEGMFSQHYKLCAASRGAQCSDVMKGSMHTANHN